MNALIKLALAGATALSLAAGVAQAQNTRSTLLSKDVSFNLNQPGELIPVRKELGLVGPEFESTVVLRVVAEGSGCGEMIVYVNGSPLAGSEMTICTQLGRGIKLAGAELNFELGRDGARSVQLHLLWGQLQISKIGVLVNEQESPWTLRGQLQQCLADKQGLQTALDDMGRNYTALRSENQTLQSDLRDARTRNQELRRHVEIVEANNRSCEASRTSLSSENRRLDLENRELRTAIEQLRRRCSNPPPPPVCPPAPPAPICPPTPIDPGRPPRR